MFQARMTVSGHCDITAALSTNKVH